MDGIVVAYTKYSSLSTYSFDHCLPKELSSTPIPAELQIMQDKFLLHKSKVRSRI